MTAKSNMRLFPLLIVIFIALRINLYSQEKQSYSGIRDAVSSSRILKGKVGPRDVKWIDNGNSYSYTDRNNSTGHKEISHIK